MRLEEIMTPDVATIQETESAEAAYQLLLAEDIHHLLVTDAYDGIAGVVSERDLGNRASRRWRQSLLVGDVMTRQVLVASPDTTVREAANLLRGHRVGSLPIVDRGQVVGIVTISDLLELIGRGVEPAAAKRERRDLRHHGGPRHRPESHVS